MENRYIWGFVTLCPILGRQQEILCTLFAGKSSQSFCRGGGACQGSRSRCSQNNNFSDFGQELCFRVRPGRLRKYLLPHSRTVNREDIVSWGEGSYNFMHNWHPGKQFLKYRDAGWTLYAIIVVTDTAEECMCHLPVHCILAYALPTLPAPYR